MKARSLRIWITAAFVTAALLISPLGFAAEQGEKEDLRPRITVQVDGLTCPFCAYGLEKRIKKLSAVEKSAINIKEGTVGIFPKAGQHIDIDEVKKAVESGGFTPRKVRVALVGKLTEWEGKPAFSIVSTNKEKQKK